MTPEGRVAESAVRNRLAMVDRDPRFATEGLMEDLTPAWLLTTIDDLLFEHMYREALDGHTREDYVAQAYQRLKQLMAMSGWFD